MRKYQKSFVGVTVDEETLNEKLIPTKISPNYIKPLSAFFRLQIQGVFLGEKCYNSTI